MLSEIPEEQQVEEHPYGNFLWVLWQVCAHASGSQGGTGVLLFHNYAQNMLWMACIAPCSAGVTDPSKPSVGLLHGERDRGAHWKVKGIKHAPKNRPPRAIVAKDRVTLWTTLTSVYNLAVTNAPLPKFEPDSASILQGTAILERSPRHRCCILKSGAIRERKSRQESEDCSPWVSPVPSSEKPIHERKLTNQPKAKWQQW